MTRRHPRRAGGVRCCGSSLVSSSPNDEKEELACRRMTCCSASGCGCSRSRARSVSGRPAGRWVCTTRPTTAGRRRSSDGAWRRLRPRERQAAADAERARPASGAADRRASRSASPGLGPKRISAELAREKWGGLRISPNGVWRVHEAARARTRAASSLAFVAGYAAALRAHAAPILSRSGTSRRPGRASWSGSTASTSAASPARRAPSGSTPRSTSPPASPGPELHTQPAQPARSALHARS